MENRKKHLGYSYNRRSSSYNVDLEDRQDEEWEDVDDDNDDDKKRNHSKFNPLWMGIMIIWAALLTCVSLYYFADVSHMNVVDTIHTTFHSYHLDTLSHSLPHNMYHHVSISDVSSSSASAENHAEDQAVSGTVVDNSSQLRDNAKSDTNTQVQQQNTEPIKLQLSNEENNSPNENTNRKSTLQTEADELIRKLKELKQQETVMETDEAALALIAKLQSNLRELLPLIYGEPPYFLEMSLTFPNTMPDASVAGNKARILIELAPIEHVPYCVYYFLQVATNWQAGDFHRNAGHVLQAQVLKQRQGGLAFQEYSPHFPHKKFTMGYAGRPGGPAFYISTVDNTENHGPASQGSKTEADGCFGRVVAYLLHNDNEAVYHTGFDVVRRMQKQPGAQKGGSGFINGGNNYIHIDSFRRLTPEETQVVLRELPNYSNAK